MKIGQRLLLGFLLIVLINIIAGAIIVLNIGSVQACYNEKKNMDNLAGHMKDARLVEKEFRSSYDPALAVEFQMQYKNITRDIYLLETGGLGQDIVDFPALDNRSNEYHDLVLANPENSLNLQNLWRSEQDIISSPGGLKDNSLSIKARIIELGMKNNDMGTGLGYLYDIQQGQTNYILTHDPSYLNDIRRLSNETIAWADGDPKLTGDLWRYTNNLDVLSSIYKSRADTVARIDAIVDGMQGDIGKLDARVDQSLDDTMAWTFAVIGALIVFSLALSVAISVVVTRSISRPIESLAKVSEKIAAGDIRKKIEVTGNDEVSSLGRSMQKMLTSLKERMEFNDAMVRNIMDFQVIVGSEGRIIYVNEPALKLTGYAYREVIGKYYQELITGLPHLDDIKSDGSGSCMVQRKGQPPLISTYRASAVKNAEGRRIGTMVMAKGLPYPFTG